MRWARLEQGLQQAMSRTVVAPGQLQATPVSQMPISVLWWRWSLMRHCPPSSQEGQVKR